LVGARVRGTSSGYLGFVYFEVLSGYLVFGQGRAVTASRGRRLSAVAQIFGGSVPMSALCQKRTSRDLFEALMF
jgi:hypothetical protein